MARVNMYLKNWEEQTVTGNSGRKCGGVKG